MTIINRVLYLLFCTMISGLLVLACGDSATGADPDTIDPADTLSNDSPSDIQIAQKILFEISYVNFAWGYVCRGLYVDNEGYVYTYDHSDERWIPGNEDFFTEKQLFDKYSHNPTLVDSVSMDTLGAMFELILPASNGALSVRVNACADIGGQSYTAFVADDKSSKYYPVLLYQAGDWARKNLSDEARQLFEWLQTLNDGQYSNPACAYPE